EYREQIKSDVADMKNTGGRGAGSITAAMLLREFVGDTPWVHLDIAGVDIYERDKGVIVKGASGIPVRTLVQLVLQTAGEGAGAAAGAGCAGRHHGQPAGGALFQLRLLLAGLPVDRRRWAADVLPAPGAVHLRAGRHPVLGSLRARLVFAVPGGAAAVGA